MIVFRFYGEMSVERESALKILNIWERERDWIEGERMYSRGQ